MSLTAAPVDPRAPLPPAVVILGNDAQLAARPATPVQLAHACLALGYRAAIPASWGDELVASATLDIVSARAMRPVIQCACPHVQRRILGVGTELAPYLVSLVAPPVAAARYLRMHSPTGLRVTYVGHCPAASDDSIDARLTPDELLAQLAERGIKLSEQPEVFESVIPPDRRRHISMPGGLPEPDALWRATQLRIDTMRGGDMATEIAERVLSRAELLLDVAPTMGCVCAGAVRGTPPDAARATVSALEPPRSPFPVVELQPSLSMELPVAVVARSLNDALERTPPPARQRGDASAEREVRRESAIDIPLGAPTTEPGARRPRLTPPEHQAISRQGDAPGSAPAPGSRRRTPPGSIRVVPGAVPFASDQEGRMLPRAYVARRRSPRHGVPAVTEQAVTEQATIGGPAMDISRQEVAAERAPDPAAAPTPMRAPDATAEPSTPAKETVEAERAIEHSVEPAVRPASPAARETAVAARPALFPVVARSAAFMRGNPRVTLAVALTAGALLVGAALGYAAARRSTRAEATSAPTGRLQLDSSAASASPALRGRDTSPVNPRAGSGTQRVTAARQRTGAASGVRRRNTIVPSPGNGDATTPAAANPPPTAAAPPAAASAPIDSAVLRSRRDSALAAAHAESLAAEREAIREEIARRRARIDSILRAQGSAPATPP